MFNLYQVIGGVWTLASEEHPEEVNNTIYNEDKTLALEGSQQTYQQSGHTLAPILYASFEDAANDMLAHGTQEDNLEMCHLVSAAVDNNDIETYLSTISNAPLAIYFALFTCKRECEAAKLWTYILGTEYKEQVTANQDMFKERVNNLFSLVGHESRIAALEVFRPTRHNIRVPIS